MHCGYVCVLHAFVCWPGCFVAGFSFHLRDYILLRSNVIVLVLDNVVYMFVQDLKLEIMASKKKPEQRKLSEFFGKRKRENSEGCVIVNMQDS